MSITVTIPRSFSIPGISGLVFWLEADAITGLVDNDPVGTWEDQSSNGYDITATGGNRPTYKTNILNGNPVVRFDGVNHFMRNGAVTPVSGSSNRTLFLVIDSTVTSATEIVSFGEQSSGNAFDLTPEFAVRVFGGNRIWTTSASTNPEIFTVVLNGTATTDLTAWVNSSMLSVSSTGSLTINTTNGITLGAKEDGTSLWTGDLAEVILYNRVLSSVSRTKVWNYLSNKYGITL